MSTEKARKDKSLSTGCKRNSIHVLSQHKISVLRIRFLKQDIQQEKKKGGTDLKLKGQCEPM